MSDESKQRAMAVGLIVAVKLAVELGYIEAVITAIVKRIIDEELHELGEISEN